MRLAIVLLCLSALLGPGLAQTQADCNRAIPGCATCEWQGDEQGH